MKQHVSPQYIAGLIDGEGCFDFNLHKRCCISRLRIGLVERDSHILNLLHKQYGGTMQRVDAGHPDHSPQKIWYLRNKRLEPLLDDTLPYLVIKKRHVQIIQKFNKLPLEKKHDKKIKTRFKQQLSKLNRRGRF